MRRSVASSGSSLTGEGSRVGCREVRCEVRVELQSGKSCRSRGSTNTPFGYFSAAFSELQLSSQSLKDDRYSLFWATKFSTLVFFLVVRKVCSSVSLARGSSQLSSEAYTDVVG